MFKNFSLSWFLTTPGILTSLGCLLIIISIIIFVSSFIGKKGKKDKTVPNETVPIKELDAEVISSPDVKPANNSTSAVETTPVTPVAETPTPVESVVTPVVETPAPVEPVVTPVVETPAPVEPIVAPVAETPAPVEQSTSEGFAGINIEPTITPVEPSVAAPVQDTTNVTPQAEPVVYGGASPKVEPVKEEPAPKVIYGGADPLAGTGIIPTIESTTSKPKEDIESL